MASLQNKITSWLQAGILTQDQAKAILDYEDSHNSKRSWAASAVAGLGIIVLLTGIVSIIASNWERISDLSKILSYFMLQALLGLAVLKNDNKPSLLREVSITLFAGLFLAGLGLIGQIYNLGGSTWQALSFWLFLSLPIILRAASRLSPNIWFVGLISAVAIWVFDSPDQQWLDRSLISVGIAFLVATVGLYRRPLFPELFRNSARFWAFLFLAGVVTFAANALWLFATDSFWLKEEKFELGVCAIWISTLVACLGIILSKEYYSQHLSKALMIMLLAIAAYITLPFFNLIPQNSLIAFFFFELVWCTAAVAAAFAQRPRLFDLITIVITLRFVGVYFEIFGSMAATGIGLIVSGLVIISAALLWNKYRKELATYLGANV